MKRDIFGINMKKYCHNHEARVRGALEGKKSLTPELIERHREKLAILQHERLVHLIVTVMVVFVELFVVDLVLLHPEAVGLAGAAVLLALVVLLGFYFCHYFVLENTVQRWYRLLDRLLAKAENGHPAGAEDNTD